MHNDQPSNDVETLKAQVRELKAQNAELERQLHQSSQTGLPIRRTLHRAMAEISPLEETGFRPVIAVIRLDRAYERIRNSRDRHKALLFASVLRMQSVVGQQLYQSDRLEEFFVLFPHVRDYRWALRILEELAGEVARPHEPPANDVVFGCHIGVARCSNGEETVEDLLQNAFIAVDEGERRGSAVRLYDEELGSRYREREQLEKKLKSAIQNAFEGFGIYYQPLVDRTRRVSGAEALLRWGDGGFGVMTPGQFIPLAEETGDIRFIGQWTLYNAARQMRDWRRAGGDPNFYVSVNLASAQFKQPDLVLRVTGILDTLGLSGEHLVVELTERAVMDEPERAIERMQELRKRGVRISIDDFGTGYSSLSYLRQFPIDAIKIDKAFIRDVDSSRHNQEIVKAVISIGKALHLETVAEGVETEAELAFLLDEGCDYFQGFLFARPLPPPDFASLVGLGTRDAATALRSTDPAETRVRPQGNGHDEHGPSDNGVHTESGKGNGTGNGARDDASLVEGMTREHSR
jgi:EAL domain-containing protein (putative c-di-GMP-specific phosphodiesterase class I)